MGLGTDGAASNNLLDVLAEVRLAAMLAKVSAGDGGAIPAEQALRMATIDAARALRRDHEIGSIEKGKIANLLAQDADFVVRYAGGNNADLPPACHPGDGSVVPDHADEVADWDSRPFSDLFAII